MKIQMEQWEWHLDDPEMLRVWFPNFRDAMADNTVKSNTQRDVFNIEAAGKKYFVKFFHPTSLLQKTRSKILPKALSELNSAKLLEDCGIATPRIAGWGRRGSESMLVSEAVIDAPDARRYWFSSVLHGASGRGEFLAKFAEFLRKFLDSGIYHPDFHLGNILVEGKGESLSFVMIDPYGAVKLPKPRHSFKTRMLCVIGSFRGELPDAEAAALLQKILPEQDPGKALVKWHRILRLETRKTARLWMKRAPRIMSDPRYSRVFPTPDAQLRVRANFAGELCVEPDKALQAFSSDPKNVLEFKSSEKAGNLWKKSYLREFHRLPQQLPIAWIMREDTKDSKILLAKGKDISLPSKDMELREKLAVSFSGVFS